MKQVILGTAGHIDHGKTSLIKALTGIDTDRLKEEKERGITIDLGFAFMDLPGDIQLGIVDVPGHERFVKNMLAGVGGIDFVLLVIAADEGVMPQTREHLAICELLRIKDGLVALTKIDMVEESWLHLVQEDVASFMEKTFLAGKPIVPVSSKTGQGLEDLKVELARIAAKVQERATAGPCRLPIDRVFTMKGFGTILTGTMTAGSLRLGEAVEVLPKGIQAKIRGLQVHNQSVEVASAGQRVAVNLQGIEKEQLERGDVLVSPGSMIPASVLEARFSLLSSSPRPLKNRSRVRFHLGTSELIARMVLLDASELAPGSEAFMRIHLEGQAVARARDRYVIRSFSPVETIGGGEILALGSGRRRRSSPDLLSELEILRAGSDEERLRIYLKQGGPNGLTPVEIGARTPFYGPELQSLLEELQSKKEIRVLEEAGKRVLESSVYDTISVQILARVEHYHRQAPLKPGIPKGELRTRFPQLEDRVFLWFLDALVKEKKLVVEREIIRCPSHQVTLADDMQQVKERIEEAFRKGGVQPPNLEEVYQTLGLKHPRQRELINVLVNEKRLVRVKEQIVFHSEALKRAEEVLLAYLNEHKEITAAQFRDLLNISRKHAIPLLEYFDNRRLTMRVGDSRVLLGKGK